MRKNSALLVMGTRSVAGFVVTCQEGWSRFVARQTPTFTCAKTRS
jgi:hypothetical protein